MSPVMIHADTLKIARRFILRFSWKKTFAGTCLSLSLLLPQEDGRHDGDEFFSQQMAEG